MSARHTFPNLDAPLTARELAVLRLVAEGRTNGEIAEALGISFLTARNHVSNILGKLGVDSREEAAAWWRVHGETAEARPARRSYRWSRGIAGLTGLRLATVLGSALVALGLLAGLAALLLMTWPRGGDDAVPAADVGSTPTATASPTAQAATPVPAGSAEAITTAATTATGQTTPPASPTAPPTPGPAPVLWEQEFGDGFYTLPAVDGERVYVSVGSNSHFDARESYVTALDQASGAPLWRFDTATIPLVPLAAEGTLYVGTGNGTIYALSAETGEVRWQQQVNAMPFTLQIANDRVFVSTVDPETYSFDGIDDVNVSSEVAALDAMSGAVLWRQPVECLQGFVTPGETLAYIATDCRIGGQVSKLVAVDQQTGAEVWNTATGPAQWPAIVAGDAVYLAAIGLSAFDAATGAERWHADPPNRGGYFRPFVQDGVVYVNSNTHSLDALDAGTGAIVWSTRYPDCSGYQFTIDGTFYGTSCGEVGAQQFDESLGSDSPTFVWGYSDFVGEVSPPAIGDGLLAFGNTYGRLVVFDIARD